jgi:carbon monoxide dehydrogenase subunit G
MFKIIAGVVGAIIAAVLVFAATKPDTFVVERGIAINAPPEAIFPFINDFHQWNAWSPYEHVDPNMQRTYSGAESGVGAVYNWSGNSDIGAGRLEITESTPPSKVALNLDFTKPMELSNKVVFALAADGGATRTTWTMSGPVPYPAKIMHVFINMDKMVGGDFEKGLVALKEVSEKAAAAAPPAEPAAETPATETPASETPAPAQPAP